MTTEYIIRAESVTVEYDDKPILYDINIQIPPHSISAVMGPENSGKSTFLRLFNRMNDDREGFWLLGKIYINGEDIYADTYSGLEQLRSKVGLIGENPQFFGRNIIDDISLPMRWHDVPKSERDGRIEDALRSVRLWNELRDHLNKPVTMLNGSDKQRFCIARALVLQPEILLLDEPTYYLDSVETAELEEVIYDLRPRLTVLLATANVQQAGRLSDNTAFLYQGELLEWNDTRSVFTNPRNELTMKYITGRFG